MEFTKYKDFKDYHWKEYASKNNYYDHVEYLKKWIKEKNGLEVGCGDGLIAYELGFKGIDVEETGISLAKEHGVDAEVGTAYELEKYGMFDTVLLADTLEHLEFPDKALKEISKITKVLYVVVPNQTNVEEFAYTKWNQESLTKFMSENGWKEISQDIQSFVPEGEPKIYGKYENIVCN